MKDYYTYGKEPKEEDMITPERVLRNYWATLKKDHKARHEALTVSVTIAVALGIAYLLAVLKSNGIW